ncbi:MAG: hypothetical protein ACOWWM_09690 [Desulfobacterales bacterium]
MAIEVKISGLREIDLMLSGVRDGSHTVLRRAINKTLTGVRTDMTDAAAEELNLTKTVIRKEIKMRKASFTSLAASTWRAGRPVPLAKFRQTRAVKAGVSVKVKKTSRRVIVRHAFMATMKSGHVGVFWRKSDRVGTGNTNVATPAFAGLPERYRLPIRELTGPRVEDILARPEVISDLEKKAAARALKNVDHELKFMLSQL